MSNIYLHSNNKSGMLKDDINKEKDLEYRRSLPYDAMGDFDGVIGSILPSAYFSADDFQVEIPSADELQSDIHKLITNEDVAALLEVDMSTSWSCVAEKNYYWTFGG